MSRPGLRSPEDSIDQDVLSLSGAKFGSSIAAVPHGTGDAVRLTGVTAAALKRADFAFHA